MKIDTTESFDPDGLLRSLAAAFPLIAEMHETEQDPVWHAEGDVRIHTRMVLEHAKQRMASVQPEYRRAFVIGCALHDIGKSRTTKRQWRADEGENGRECVVSPRHAVVGRSYLYPRIARLSGLLSVEDADLVCSLVGYHHHVRSACNAHDSLPSDRRPLSEGERARMWSLARVSDLQRLYHLERCDTLGRISLDTDPTWSDTDKLWWLDWFKDVAEFHDVWDAPPFVGWREHFEHAFAGESPEFIENALAKAAFDFGKKRIFCEEEGVSRAYEWRKGCPKLVLLCGPPGSGKSTLAERYEHVVALDELRDEIAGGRHNQKMNGQVQQEALKRIRVHLANKQTVVLDSTALYRDQRRSLLDLATKYGAATHIVAFATDPRILRKRNDSREHPVPAEYLEEAIRKYDFPLEREAHRLTVVDSWGERDLGAI